MIYSSELHSHFRYDNDYLADMMYDHHFRRRFYQDEQIQLEADVKKLKETLNQTVASKENAAFPLLPYR